MKLALLLALGLAACGPTRGDDFGDDDGSGSNNGSNGPVGTSCSSDLHDVLDDQGNVVGSCPADLGCAAGVCVPACDAAAASQGSVGCEFTVATPSFYPTIAPPCFAVFLANNWPKDTTVTISRAGVTYDATMFGRVPDGTADTASWPTVPATGIASSNVGVFLLSQDPASQNSTPTTCPAATAVNVTGGTAVYTGSNNATGIGQAFHITTSFPVSAYDIMPYGGASSYLPSAELLLPTSAWGTNYVTTGPQPTQGIGWGQVVASTDNTQVMITPKTALPSGTSVAAAPANATTTYTLNAGQYIQWQSAGDWSGGVITSSAPVSVTGGTTYLCKGSSTTDSSAFAAGGCDSGHQLTPPVAALGSEYVGMPYATRRADLQEESIVYRLVGAADGTTLTFNPPVAGAPASLAVGQVVEFEATGAFVVTSQDAMHPFYVGQYMSGCFVQSGSRPGVGPNNTSNCLGDEEYVDILPPAQWLASYTFFTDPTYATTNLVVVRKADSGGTFSDVTVDCLGTLTGWTPVAGGGQYEMTRVDLQRVNPIGTCTNGRHTASSNGAFTVMVWGLSEFASYAYPAGGNVGKINPVVVIGKTH